MYVDLFREKFLITKDVSCRILTTPALSPPICRRPVVSTPPTTLLRPSLRLSNTITNHTPLTFLLILPATVLKTISFSPPEHNIQVLPSFDVVTDRWVLRSIGHRFDGAMFSCLVHYFSIRDFYTLITFHNFYSVQRLLFLYKLMLIYEYLRQI